MELFLLAFLSFRLGPAWIGISVGTIVAGACSWERNKSILLALIHGLLLGWIYVIYWALTRNK